MPDNIKPKRAWLAQYDGPGYTGVCWLQPLKLRSTDPLEYVIDEDFLAGFLT